MENKEINDLKAKLDKKLNKLKGRDERGIQTLFRIISKNHYTLLQMVDNKANIILTVNSIIISITMGGLVMSGVPADEFDIQYLHTIVTLITCLLSMIYAILSIIPNNEHGDANKHLEGLLYAGSFKKLNLPEYESQISELLENGEKLYSAIVKDVYYLGIIIDHKQKKIVRSMKLFMFGMGLSILTYFITRII